MTDDTAIAQLGRGHVCPPNVGPAWRAACEYGFDLSLATEALERTPAQWLGANQRALDSILELL